MPSRRGGRRSNVARHAHTEVAFADACHLRWTCGAGSEHTRRNRLHNGIAAAGRPEIEWCWKDTASTPANSRCLETVGVSDAALPPSAKSQSEFVSDAAEIKAGSEVAKFMIEPAMLDAEGLTTGVSALLKDMMSCVHISQQLNCFHNERVQQITISDYFARLQYLFCSPQCYVVGLIYINRVTKLHPGIVFSESTWLRLAISALVVAVKFHDDTIYGNRYYAKVGGVSLRKLNMLESAFVQLLEWKLHVAEEEYNVYTKMISARR